jgi:hypothetical protein
MDIRQAKWPKRAKTGTDIQPKRTARPISWISGKRQRQWPYTSGQQQRHCTNGTAATTLHQRHGSNGRTAKASAAGSMRVTSASGKAQ